MHEAANDNRVPYGTYSEMPDDGRRYEIVDGKIHVSPTASLLHQHALGELYVLLADYFKEPARAAAVFAGRLTVILSDAPPRDAEIVEPDLVEEQYLLDAEAAGDESLSVPAFPGLTIGLGKLWLRLEPASGSR